jgi:hypothetical protein
MGEIGVYLDASLLVPLFVTDALAARAEDLLPRIEARPIVSDFAASEVSSAIARKLRMAVITHAEARAAFVAVDARVATTAERVPIEPADVRLAERLVRRLDLPLRVPDAMSIAIALRVRARLASFDVRMLDAARAVGLPVLDA